MRNWSGSEDGRVTVRGGDENENLLPLGYLSVADSLIFGRRTGGRLYRTVEPE